MWLTYFQFSSGWPVYSPVHRAITCFFGIGVYDRPPQQQGATLLPELRVGRDGAVRVVRAVGDGATAPTQIATR